MKQTFFKPKKSKETWLVSMEEPPLKHEPRRETLYQCFTKIILLIFDILTGI